MCVILTYTSSFRVDDCCSRAGSLRAQGRRHDATAVFAITQPTGCCFVLLIPTPEEYRVPRVNPGVTASKLFPPYFRRWLRRALLCLTDHSRKPGTAIRGSEWGPASAWPHQWVAPRGQGDPHFVLEMDLLLSRRLVPCFPATAVMYFRNSTAAVTVANGPECHGDAERRHPNGGGGIDKS